MVFDGIVIGLVVGFVRAGWRNALTALSQLKLRGGWLFPALLLLQLLLYTLHAKFSWVDEYNGYLWRFTWSASTSSD